LFCWGCGGNSGCVDGVGNVRAWRSDLIGWTGSVISGIAVLTNFWKPDVSSSMVSPAGGLDNDPGSGVPVWISIQSAAGLGKKSNGCWKRRTIGRSPGKSLGASARSQRVLRVPPGDPSMRSHAGAALLCRLKCQRQRRLWLRSSNQISRTGRRMTASESSAGHGRRRCSHVQSQKRLRIRLLQDGLCRVPVAAGPINGWRVADAG
jgi:hypothetical protein